LETQTQQGMAAMRRGDRLAAKQLLLAAVESDPKDINAWLWLSGAVDTDQERLHCLQQVLKIDPENAMAGKGIALLISRGAVTLQIPQASPSTTSRSPIVREQEASHNNHPEKMVVTTSLPIAAKQPQITAQRQSGNEVIFNERPSFLPVFLTGGMLCMLLIILGIASRKSPGLIAFVVIPISICVILAIMVGLIRRYFTRYTLTRSKLIVQKGVLSRQKKTIPITKIQDVSYQQQILERIFGFGDVVVESAGEWGSVHLVDVNNCVELSEEILKVVQKN
jgi:membrane protein YdbS with pleckstrin-like domain